MPQNPLPSYDELQKEEEVNAAKISSFLKGKTVAEIREHKPMKKKKSEEPEAERETMIPLLDKHAQGALRRRIVHDNLERV